MADLVCEATTCGDSADTYCDKCGVHLCAVHRNRVNMLPGALPVYDFCQPCHQEAAKAIERFVKSYINERLLP